MRALEFWKAVTVDKANLLERIIALFHMNAIRFCVIGVGVNAYAEPLVTLDLDLVVAVDQQEEVESLLSREFQVERFPHSLNVSIPDSRVRVQVMTDPRYARFLDHAEAKEVLEIVLPVARPEDLLQGKIWAAQDPTRRPSTQQKDLLDIARLLEAFPSLRSQLPDDIEARLAQARLLGE